MHEISNKVVCATSKGSDQPAHTRSLIRAYASRLASSKFTLVKMPHCWKSHVKAQMLQLMDKIFTNLDEQVTSKSFLPSVPMQERTKWALEAAAFLPETTCYIRYIMSKLAVRTATISFQKETTRLALKP